MTRYVSLDQIAEAIEGWLVREGWPEDGPAQRRAGFTLELKVDARSPWVSVEVKRRMPYFASDGPAEMSLAVWKQTGAVHRVVEGAVEDPELFEIDPLTPEERARQIRESVEAKLGKPFRPEDVRAVEAVIAEVVEEAENKGMIPASRGGS